MPFFSVIIPTFNRSNTVIRAVQSVLDGVFVDIEVIVVDDCSTDDTLELLGHINDQRFRVIKLSDKSNANVARNRGAKCAKSEFLCFLDSDDSFEPTHLKNLFDRINNNPSVDIFLESFQVINGKKKNLVDYPVGIASSEKISMALANHIIPITCSTISVRRNAFYRSGGFDQNLLRQQDRDFLLSLCMAYDYFYLSNDHSVLKYQCSDSISRNSLNYFGPLFYLLKKHKNTFAKVRIEIRLYLLARGLLQSLKNLNFRDLFFALKALRESKGFSSNIFKVLISYSKGKRLRKVLSRSFVGS